MNFLGGARDQVSRESKKHVVSVFQCPVDKDLAPVDLEKICANMLLIHNIFTIPTAS